MASAKDLQVKPIASADAIAFVKAHHYSGKVAQNSQLHLGVFLQDRLHGVMQFGPSLDKRKIQGLVSGTLWHEFLELNRMAFDDVLPRNSESRALSVAWRLLKKHAPQVKWVVSFADGTQCGDGTIYRAAGFVLTGIKENNQIWEAPSGNIYQSNYARGVANCNIVAAQAMAEVMSARVSRVTEKKGKNIFHTGSVRPGISGAKFAGLTNGASSMKVYKDAGWKPLSGFQLRYMYFIDPAYRARLTVPELAYSEIKARGATMYKGQRPTSGTGETDNAAHSHAQTGGASPTVPLLNHGS